MFVGVGGTVGGKDPPMPRDIDARPPLYRMDREGTDVNGLF